MDPLEANMNATGARVIYPECIEVDGTQSEKIGALRAPEYEPTAGANNR